jgi:hypothetical protein
LVSLALVLPVPLHPLEPPERARASMMRALASPASPARSPAWAVPIR